jgi:hypothetical protein
MRVVLHKYAVDRCLHGYGLQRLLHVAPIQEDCGTNYTWTLANEDAPAVQLPGMNRATSGKTRRRSAEC